MNQNLFTLKTLIPIDIQMLAGEGDLIRSQRLNLHRSQHQAEMVKGLH